ncbi:MAG TPA: GNAT family N-acetyltransferase, partial [bacterium]|nr:GNAT family N-acetyltransferase [bacterium]
GMAVRATYRSHGVGGQLMGELVKWLENQRFEGLLWCNARSAARRFYEQHGWSVVGEEFETPPLGPHFRMIRPVGK